MFSVKSTSILLPFLTVAQQEWGTRKIVSWSVAVYHNTVSSQCYLTAQIEPMQDKTFHNVLDHFKSLTTLLPIRYKTIIAIRHGNVTLILYLSTLLLCICVCECALLCPYAQSTCGNAISYWNYMYIYIQIPSREEHKFDSSKI